MAVIYTRISDDTAGERAGVERQRADCLALAERQDWTVVGHYEDNDRSAYSGKPRPEFERRRCQACASTSSRTA